MPAPTPTPGTRPASVRHRTLVLGDSHGSIAMLREALRVAQHQRADRLVSVGDFGVWPGTGGRMFLDACADMAAARGVEIIIAPGNHDDYDQLESAPVDDDGLMVLRPGVRAAPRGHVLDAGARRWLLCGGAASIDGPDGPREVRQSRGPFDTVHVIQHRDGSTRTYQEGGNLGGWWPQETVTDADVAACAAAGPVDVLVTHDAPAGVALESIFVGLQPWLPGDAVREKIATIRTVARPALHLAGHWHQHTDVTDDIGRLVVLSDNTHPQQRQWTLVDDDGQHDTPVVRGPVTWSRDTALTAHNHDAAVAHLAYAHAVDLGRLAVVALPAG
jgi:Icc-related predicted phosphoesterase